MTPGHWLQSRAWKDKTLDDPPWRDTKEPPSVRIQKKVGPVSLQKLSSGVKCIDRSTAHSWVFRSIGLYYIHLILVIVVLLVLIQPWNELDWSSHIRSLWSQLTVLPLAFCVTVVCTVPLNHMPADTVVRPMTCSPLVCVFLLVLVIDHLDVSVTLAAEILLNGNGSTAATAWWSRTCCDEDHLPIAEQIVWERELRTLLLKD